MTIANQPKSFTENAPDQAKPALYVIYHADCADGCGAAAVAWGEFGTRANYRACQYSQPFPNIPDGSEVYILDFSWPYNDQAREELLKLNARVKKLVVLDHHKTAESALADLPFATFSRDQSGAVMAWEYFRKHGTSTLGQVPDLLEYIQDRDLWLWRLPDSRAVNAAIALLPKTPATFYREMNDPEAIRGLQRQGQTILAYQQRTVEQLAKQAHYLNLADSHGNKRLVCAVNTPVLQSELGEYLLEQNGQTIVALYSYVYDSSGALQIRFSLRAKAGHDATPIAKAYGGGGHPQACGFTVDRGMFEVWGDVENQRATISDV